jgi:hypothetical protein
MELRETIKRFGVEGELIKLPGGTRDAFRSGDVVFKLIKERSLENNHSPQLAGWIAEFSSTLPQEGFRIPKGVKTKDGKWITEDGWTAWTFVEGNHATKDDIAQCIDAINDFNKALKVIPKNPLMDENQTAFGQAHRLCLGEKPQSVHSLLQPYIDKLYELRVPVDAEHQLIHGDLNSENILVAPGLPPAFIDFSPFWGPPELALAIFANFIGPRQRDASVLEHFKDQPNFDQMLIRAAIRMLLVIDILDKDRNYKLEGWDGYAEKEAVEIIIDWVNKRKE